MSRWFRFYDDAINDPKALKLSDKTYRIWVGILCVASKNDGQLPPFEDIAILLRMKQEKLQPELEKLIAAELIDHDDDGMRPHNWNKRQFKSDVSTERVQRFRKQERNVSETPPETEAESDTEQKEFRPKRVRTDYPEDFEIRFWRPYPRTVVMSKSEAFKAWGKISDDDRTAAIAAVPKYKAFLNSKPDHPAVHACRFLTQRRFDGFTADTERAGPPVAPAGAPSDAELRERYGRQISGGIQAPASNSEAAGEPNHAEKLRSNGAGIREENGHGAIPNNHSRTAGVRRLGELLRPALGRAAVGVQSGDGRENQDDDGPDAMAGMVR